MPRMSPIRPSIDKVAQRLGLDAPRERVCQKDWRLHGRIRKGAADGKRISGRKVRDDAFHIQEQCACCGRIRKVPVSGAFAPDRSAIDPRKQSRSWSGGGELPPMSEEEAANHAARMNDQFGDDAGVRF